MNNILAALLSVSSTTLSDEEKFLFEKYNPLGVTLFKRNLSSTEQTKSLISSIKETIGRDDVIIALDQEGGRVNRLNNIGFPSYTSQNILGQINSEEITSIHAKIIARDMKSVGANFNMAPVLDIDYPETTQALKNRTFGNDNEKISYLGKILCNTYVNEGICPCIKHLPGHGRAACDPHLGLPVINCSLKDLEQDLYPFKKLSDMSSAMTAHILIPEIDSQNPITLSPIGIDTIIRKTIGFDGLLLSDAIEMGALKGTIIERAKQSWFAGCDIIIYCGGKIEELYKLCLNGKIMADKSLERFEKVKKIINLKKNTIILDKEEKKYYSCTNQFVDEDINYDATEVLHKMQKGDI